MVLHVVVIKTTVGPAHHEVLVPHRPRLARLLLLLQLVCEQVIVWELPLLSRQPMRAEHVLRVQLPGLAVVAVEARPRRRRRRLLGSAARDFIGGHVGSPAQTPWCVAHKVARVLVPHDIVHIHTHLSRLLCVNVLLTGSHVRRHEHSLGHVAV